MEYHFVRAAWYEAEIATLSPQSPRLVHRAGSMSQRQKKEVVAVTQVCTALHFLFSLNVLLEALEIDYMSASDPLRGCLEDALTPLPKPIY
jgi:hypothetical protein